jgi:hypothetical protein
VIAAATIAIIALHGYLWVRRETELIEANARDDLVVRGRALRPALVKIWATGGMIAQ